MGSNVPTAPFTNAAELAEFLQNRAYSRDLNEALPAMCAFWGVASIEELMAVPARTNSGTLSTMGAAWFAMFPFVQMPDQHVDLDDVFIGDDGYSILFWGRWNGTCTGTFQPPTGDPINLDGKTFEGLRYAYKLTFDRETRKAVLFEGLLDVSEWGRLMDSPEFARAAAATSLYPA